MAKVLITPRSLTRGGHPSFALLEEAGYEVIFSTPGVQPTEDELVELLPGCVGYLAGVEPVSRRALESAANLKVISRNGSGIDNIDLDAAGDLGIKICRTEGANAKGVAELTVGLVFALARMLPFHEAGMKDGQWERRKGIELEGRTLGLIGCGQIGREVTVRALGIGMDVIAYRRHPDTSFRPSDRFKWVKFDDVLRNADVISLHRPASPSGEPVITDKIIRKMKEGVFIINTSRASLVDDEALLTALESGRVAGAATDVWHREPPASRALAEHDRVIATPHIGGFTVESVDRATRGAVDNILKTLKKT